MENDLFSMSTDLSQVVDSYAVDIDDELLIDALTIF